MNFGSVTAQTSAMQVVHLTNCGNARLTLENGVSSIPTVVLHGNSGVSGQNRNRAMTPRWKVAYYALLREKDKSKLRERCDEAERAIKQRYREILAVFGDDPAEREALSNALHNISVTRKTLHD